MRPRSLMALAVGIFLVFTVMAAHADRGGVVRFATLPKPGPGFPEGIAADAKGNIYVSTFDFVVGNVIHIFGPNGRLHDTIPLPGSVPLGLAFDAAGNLHAADFLNGRIHTFSPPFTASSTPASIVNVCAFVFPTDCGLNAMAFDAAGNLYVSDSFGGKIYRVTPLGVVALFFAHELLTPGLPHGFPPFGANGLAFNAAGTELYIANTADDRILKLTLESMTLTTFAEGINGADGVGFDEGGRLWVAANQGDEVVALNASGRIVDRRGSFEGLGSDGAPRGLLFPASIVLSGGNIFVTNLALPLSPAVGDEPEEDVTTFTVSRIPLGKAGK